MSKFAGYVHLSKVLSEKNEWLLPASLWWRQFSLTETNGHFLLNFYLAAAVSSQMQLVLYLLEEEEAVLKQLFPDITSFPLTMCLRTLLASFKVEQQKRIYMCALQTALQIDVMVIETLLARPEQCKGFAVVTCTARKVYPLMHFFLVDRISLPEQSLDPFINGGAKIMNPLCTFIFHPIHTASPQRYLGAKL